MPILPLPDYCPPLPFCSATIATVYPPIFRMTPLTAPNRERIELPDTDFLDFDWHRSRTGETRKLVIVSHGLEGHARKKYVLGMARMLTGLGHDVACWCQRGCSDEPNRLPRSYHSGETDDLHAVIMHCLSTGRYDEISLIGFSMGGNQILKYLGENPDRIPPQVVNAATFSVPCDLDATERMIALPSRHIYFEYFMRGLRRTIREKSDRFPNVIDSTRLRGIKTLRDFDDRFTAPSNGFTDAADYYAQSSSLQFLQHIRIPTLLVNALNDPFLAPSCYPTQDAETNPNLFLEMPKYGGHVGFVLGGKENIYWSEHRAAQFLTQTNTKQTAAV
ncbi:alpha/beta fold hydrolase [Pseudodesulfovibrio sp. JC047]|uniref:YheT family hydrolase n=1 Tax=Pseudodesulfovibrio sp. JC047 TaxID=2683199 RepID=UPI0013D4D9FC|nr:alpha/beta fold hydrolase [Pseudodesulfovibrio sp. JC047]NDV18013.1 alpha/beta fold hydrolase [Pseudodesulfovibrio sp. JC047]